VSRKCYRRQIKSARNAVNQYHPDSLIGESIFAFNCTDYDWFDSANARTPVRKPLVSFAVGLSPKIQIGPMESPTAAAPAIPLEKLIPKLEEYYFSKRTLRVLHRESVFEELSHRSHQIYFGIKFAQPHEGCARSRHQFSSAFECDAARVKVAVKK
jgi:hypothetical protein